MRSIAFALAGLLTLCLMPSVISGNAVVEYEEEPVYFEHDPILIDGDSDFISENGVTEGIGTSADPFVIEGWDVEGSADDTCIEIRNAEVHFVIRECRLHDSGIGHGTSGILLVACSNGTIEDCEAFNHDEGLCLVACENILIRYSYCHSNSRGISLAGSEGCLVTENTCSDGNTYGIYLESGSSNNSCIGNDCSHDESTGISVGDSWNDTLAGNVCQYNGRGLELNGANSSCMVTGNWFQYSVEEGIFMMGSCNNTLSLNCISENQGYGIRADWQSSSNSVWNNTFLGNNGAGSTYDASHVQACDDGTDNRWNSTSGHGNHWSDWTTPDEDTNGIVDSPYDIDGSAGALDCYPQTEPMIIPEIRSSIVLVGVIIVVISAVIGFRRSVEKRQ